jgi:phosphoenolpyruvate-protein phosphotransferase (PTS system enzyme I)
MTVALVGLGVSTSQAIALGPTFRMERGSMPVSPRVIESGDVHTELARLDEALAASQRALKAVRHQVSQASPLSLAEFIDSHLLILEDAALVDPARVLIREHLFSAEWALRQHRDDLARIFDEMDDPYLRSRRDDIDQVIHHILGFLTSGTPAAREPESEISGCVIVAHDISPADTLLLRHRGAVALVTEFGGPLSHTAILARSLNIPAVMGVRNATRYLRQGETLVVDGEAGIVIADADYQILNHYRQRLIALSARRNRLRRLLQDPCQTQDGQPVTLLANLELPEDAQLARANGAVGVGLYRTEFLYMNREGQPNEEEHLAAYRQVIQGLGGIPITIRTLDLGADKQVDGSASANCTSVCNPALGLRAIRLCLKDQDLFRPQLRAILRASAEGPVRLMLPMLTNLGEVEHTRALLAQARRELAQEGLPFDPRMPVGGMIEVPAAALCADAFAARLDFLSIGTNDLIQYTLATDRIDDTVNYLYDPLHPAVLRLIRMVIAAGRRQATPVAMCGEMAGDRRFTRLLLGLGLRQFSMQPGSLLEIKEIILEANATRLEAAVADLYGRLDTEPAEELLDALNRGA